LTIRIELPSPLAHSDFDYIMIHIELPPPLAAHSDFDYIMIRIELPSPLAHSNFE